MKLQNSTYFTNIWQEETLIAENPSKNQQRDLHTCPPKDSAWVKESIIPKIAKISDLSLTCVRKVVMIKWNVKEVYLYDPSLNYLSTQIVNIKIKEGQPL